MRASGCSTRPGNEWLAEAAGWLVDKPLADPRCRGLHVRAGVGAPARREASNAQVRPHQRPEPTVAGGAGAARAACRHPGHGVVEHRGRARLRGGRLVDSRDPRRRRAGPGHRERLRRRRARLRRAADREGCARRLSDARREPVRRGRHHRDRRSRRRRGARVDPSHGRARRGRAPCGTSPTATSACSATSRRSTRLRCSTCR